jgi:hypothetical protein
MPGEFYFSAISVVALILLVVGGIILLIVAYRRHVEHLAAPNGIVKAGRYLSGHPAMKLSTEVECFFHRGAAHFIAPVRDDSNAEIQIVGRVPVSAISAVTMEDDARQSNIDADVFRVHVAWTDADIINDTLFEFGGSAARGNAKRFFNVVRNSRPVM